jgi:Protein of unknown function (DUF4238)
MGLGTRPSSRLWRTVKIGPLQSYRELVAGRTPSEPAKANFAMFAAQLHVRTVGYRLDMANLIAREHQIHRYAYGAHDGAFRTLIRRVEKDLGAPLDDDRKEELRRGLMDPSNLKIQVPKELTIEGLDACNRLAPLLFGMSWSLVVAKEGFFVTGDCPLVRWVHPKSVHPIRGDGGFANPTAQVSLALTPKLMLLMTPRRNIPSRAEADRGQVNAWNHQRAYRAQRHVYAHLEHRGLQRLATHFKGSRPTLTTAGFGPEEFGEVEVPRKWPRDVAR